MVLDLGLPDMSGVELIEQVKQQSQSRSLPIIVYTAKDLLLEEKMRLKALAESILIKDVRSPERLLDETLRTAEVLWRRRGQDVTRVQLSQANASVEERRVALIGFKARVRDLSDQLAQAQRAARLAYSAAERAGWTAEDLKRIGLEPPKAETKRAPRRRRPNPTDSTGAAEVPAMGDPDPAADS